jgi:hypothetical protein
MVACSQLVILTYNSQENLKLVKVQPCTQGLLSCNAMFEFYPVLEYMKNMVMGNTTLEYVITT